MIIKKYTDVNGTNQWVAQAVETTAQSIKTTMGGTAIFDEFDKIKTPYLPDVAFGGMKFIGTISPNSDSEGYLEDLILGSSTLTISQTLNQAYPGLTLGQAQITPDDLNRVRGSYFVITGSSVSLLEQANGVYGAAVFDDGVLLTEQQNAVSLEIGDWVIVTGYDTSNQCLSFSVINNTYDLASSDVTGIVKLGYTSNGKNYKVDTTSAGLFVNVPWVSDEISTTEIDNGDSSATRLITGRRAQHLLRNNVDTATTANFATGTTASGATKAVNLGTGGAAGSTTNVVIGSAVAGSTTINSPTTHVSALNATTGTFSGALSATTGTFTGDVSVTSAGGITAKTASQADAVILAGRSGGTNSRSITLVPATLTASHTLTLPNITGTLAVTDDLHVRSHAMTSTDDHTANNWKLFYSNGSGNVVELGLGTAGQVLKATGIDSAPEFAAETAYTAGEGLTLTGTEFKQTYPVYHATALAGLPTGTGVSVGAFGFEY